MKENQSNKKKNLSEDELLDMSGGNSSSRSPLPQKRCSIYKNKKDCERSSNCQWDEQRKTCRI